MKLLAVGIIQLSFSYTVSSKINSVICETRFGRMLNKFNTFDRKAIKIACRDLSPRLEYNPSRDVSATLLAPQIYHFTLLLHAVLLSYVSTNDLKYKLYYKSYKV